MDIPLYMVLSAFGSNAGISVFPSLIQEEIPALSISYGSCEMR